MSPVPSTSLPDLSRLTPAQALGLTGAGEARSELVPGKGWRPAPAGDMAAVMWTVRNRLDSSPSRFGTTIPDVCFEPSQYSCWNPRSGENHDWLLGEAWAVLDGDPGRPPAPVVQACVSAAAGILGGIVPDPTAGATHYYAPLSMVPPGRIPAWARGRTPCATVGQHLFFKGV